MKIVIDTNIVFSAILNTRSRIGQIITTGSKYFDFYSVYLLKYEILNHQDKICKITGFDKKKFYEIYEIITSRIRFIDEILISNKDFEKAIELVSGIDEDDALFVALSNHLNANFWTGDRKLAEGLKRKEYKRIISTEVIFEKFIEKELRKRMKRK